MTDSKDIKDSQSCLELCIISWICCILIKLLHYSAFIKGVRHRKTIN